MVQSMLQRSLFGLVTLFNKKIPSFIGYLMPKPSLLKKVKVKLVIIVEGGQKASFSIATCGSLNSNFLPSPV